MTPLEAAEDQMELLALNTRPVIVYRIGMRAPLRPGQMIGQCLMLPLHLWSRELSATRMARLKGIRDRRAARELERSK